MISSIGVTVRFGKRVLFEDVNIKFTKGNCYGLIGANGAGKSTFLKVLSGEIEPSKGDIAIERGARLSTLKQDHFAYEEFTIMDTVIMGNEDLYKIMKSKEAIYAKENFSEEDGIKAAKLEERFAELDGWNSESDAAILLNSLGIEASDHYKQMKEIEAKDKVKVLLAQSLFGNPDVLLLDEPTNDLDINSINWLQDFLMDFENTVIVVSHDRYFLNKVCTHIADVDFGKIKIYPGNYDFWYESSQLALKQAKDSNKKKEEKIKELQDFIARFSANASKSKQATSRKKTLEKIELEEIKASNRKYPYIDFKPDREPGKEVLTVKNISKTINGEKVLDNISFSVKPNNKIAVLAENELATTVLFQILAGDVEPDEGEIIWGQTITTDYFPKDNSYLFKNDEILVEWLRGYSKDPDESFVRGFLGRMLFSGDEALKRVKVLSGGEKVRCVLSKIMLSGANFLILDEPTSHLDMEAITALNEGLTKFKGDMIFASHDHQLVQTVANRIIDIRREKVYDRDCTYNKYLGME
ncbi:MAG: ATP-binding cassette domain-containing protein [Oscillospiraceae bacterium]|nr:ATP-binding cassette domain-containing protein [Oscillospiraceae bacterium]